MLSSLENWLKSWNSYSFEYQELKKINFIHKDSLDITSFSNKTYWSFSNALDDEWLLMNLSLVEELNIIVFESPTHGVVFTTLDSSENFSKTHWNFLFNVRNLPINFFDY